MLSSMVSKPGSQPFAVVALRGGRQGGAERSESLDFISILALFFFFF